MTQEERAKLQARIDALPAGNITYKTINGKKYPYLQWQEGGRQRGRRVKGDELEALQALLQQGAELLNPGGRMVVMSYHSLEDRLVKNYFRAGNFEGEVEKDFYGNPIVQLVPVSRKAIVASDEEVQRNPRARSARLRVAERKEDREG